MFNETFEALHRIIRTKYRTFEFPRPPARFPIPAPLLVAVAVCLTLPFSAFDCSLNNCANNYMFLLAFENKMKYISREKRNSDLFQYI